MTVTTARLRLEGTEDLLGLIPYLLTYQPDERLVMVVVQQGRIQLTAAMDLIALESPEEAKSSLGQALRQFPGAELAFAAWSHDEGLAEQALDTALGWFEEHPILDCAVVGPKTWRSLFTSERGSTASLRVCRSAAEAVGHGLSCNGSRDEMATQVLGPVLGQTHVFRQCPAQDVPITSSQVLELADALSARCERGEALAAADVAPLVHAVSWDVVLRDAVWMSMDRSRAEQHVRLWTQVVGLTPEAWALTPVLLLGCASWIAGQGALQNACVDRALTLDPTSSLAKLLAGINQAAVPPRMWDELRHEWLAEAV